MKNYIKVASFSLAFLSATSGESLAKIEIIDDYSQTNLMVLRETQNDEKPKQGIPMEENSADSFFSTMGGYAWSGAGTLGNMAFNFAWKSADQYVRGKIALTLAGLYLEPLIEGTASAAYYGGYVLGAMTPIPGAAPVLGTASYVTAKTTLHAVRWVPGADAILTTGFAMGLRYVTDPALDYVVLPAAKKGFSSLYGWYYS